MSKDTFQFQNGAIASTTSSGGAIGIDMFQFQNGAIARTPQKRALPGRILFQFQNGAIASKLHTGSRQNGASFNSKMVRLQVIEDRFIYKANFTFQFQNGAIASRPIEIFPLVSYLVSIPKWCDCKGRTRTSTRTHGQVSIPKWCDCKRAAIRAAITADNVSIPKWCDCKTEGEARRIFHKQVSIPKWCDCKANIRKKATEKTEFQFQNGAIARYFKNKFGKCLFMFQFQNGAIARICTS